MKHTLSLKSINNLPWKNKASTDSLLHTWKSLSVVIGKYMRPRSLLIRASTPIFSLTSSAAVCSKPVGTVAPMVTVMMSPVVASFSVEEEVDAPTVSGPCSAAPSPCDDMMRLCSRHRCVTGWCVSQLVQISAAHMYTCEREIHTVNAADLPIFSVIYEARTYFTKLLSTIMLS